jgi:hypothetical protein
MHRVAGGRRPQGPIEWLLVALAVAWLAAVALIRILGVDLTPPDIGASPNALVAGDLLRLLSSSLIIDADLPLLQAALLAVVSAVVVIRYGAVLWWVAALVGHVGSALIAYAVIAGGIALGFGSAERFADDWDYGISCVLAAELGVLCVGSVRRLRRGRGAPADVALLVATSVALLAWLLTIDWYGIEHPIAFALGAGVLMLAERRGRARPSGAISPRASELGAPPPR